MIKLAYDQVVVRATSFLQIACHVARWPHGIVCYADKLVCHVKSTL